SSRFATSEEEGAVTSFFRKFAWWRQRRRREDELREALAFHLANEADERRGDGLTQDEAGWAARRDLGNVTLLREETRTLWSWILLEQLGIGVNTAIFSFM